MACTDNTGSYVNIKELPEINDVVSGDFLIVETPSGTNILDFNNFIISLENTTFSDNILSNTADIITLSSQYTTLNTDLQTQIDSNTANINYLLTGANIETYAVFSVDNIAQTSGSVTIHSSSNIQDTVTYNPTTSAFTFQFIRNFEKHLICGYGNENNRYYRQYPWDRSRTGNRISESRPSGGYQWSRPGDGSTRSG